MTSLSFSLQELTTGVQNTMASVHSFNVAALNTRAMPPSLSQDFSNLRLALKNQWLDIKSILQQCYNVVDSLTVLIRSIKRETDAEVLAFLGDLMKQVSTIEDLCRSSISTSSEISRQFNSTSAKFASLGHYSDTDLATVLEDQTPPTVGSGLSESSAEFMRSNIAAAYPDGTASAKATSLFLADSPKHLKAILQYWTTLRHNLQPSPPGNMNVPTLQAECNPYISYWKSDREHIRVAVSVFSRSIDAISVEAVAAPSRRSSNNVLVAIPPAPPLRSRGTSRTMSLPSSPIYPSLGMQFPSSNPPSSPSTTSPSRLQLDTGPPFDLSGQYIYSDEPASYSPAPSTSSRLRKGRQSSIDTTSSSPSPRGSSDKGFLSRFVPSKKKSSLGPSADEAVNRKTG